MKLIIQIDIRPGAGLSTGSYMIIQHTDDRGMVEKGIINIIGTMWLS